LQLQSLNTKKLGVYQDAQEILLEFLILATLNTISDFESNFIHVARIVWPGSLHSLCVVHFHRNFKKSKRQQ